MGYDLPERVVKDIVTFAKRYSVRKVILFGSRARGNNTERSDIDIAVYGGDRLGIESRGRMLNTWRKLNKRSNGRGVFFTLCPILSIHGEISDYRHFLLLVLE